MKLNSFFCALERLKNSDLCSENTLGAEKSQPEFLTKPACYCNSFSTIKHLFQPVNVGQYHQPSLRQSGLASAHNPLF